MKPTAGTVTRDMDQYMNEFLVERCGRFGGVWRVVERAGDECGGTGTVTLMKNEG